MIIDKKEVEKAAKKYLLNNFLEATIWARETIDAFESGVEFSEKYVQQYVQDLIIENQLLKLYKDDEAKRFKELAVELIDWLSLDPQFTKFATNKLNEEELYELFKKENYIK